MTTQCVQVTIKIGHKANLRSAPTIEGFTHDWQVFVEGPDGEQIRHFVEKVVFHLHESFAKPKRVVKEPPFSIQESGYAGFTLPIEIYFKNKEEPRKIKFDYDLYLLAAEPVDTGRLEKLTFQNPTEEFRRKLIKAGGVGIFGQDDESNLPKPSPARNSPALDRAGYRQERPEHRSEAEKRPPESVMPKPEKKIKKERKDHGPSTSAKQMPTSEKEKEREKPPPPKPLVQPDPVFTELFGAPIKTAEVMKKQKKEKDSSKENKISAVKSKSTGNSSSQKEENKDDKASKEHSKSGMKRSAAGTQDIEESKKKLKPVNSPSEKSEKSKSKKKDKKSKHSDKSKSESRKEKKDSSKTSKHKSEGKSSKSESKSSKTDSKSSRTVDEIDAAMSETPKKETGLSDPTKTDTAKKKGQTKLELPPFSAELSTGELSDDPFEDFTPAKRKPSLSQSSSSSSLSLSNSSKQDVSSVQNGIENSKTENYNNIFSDSDDKDGSSSVLSPKTNSSLSPHSDVLNSSLNSQKMEQYQKSTKEKKKKYKSKHSEKINSDSNTSKHKNKEKKKKIKEEQKIVEKEKDDPKPDSVKQKDNMPAVSSSCEINGHVSPSEKDLKVLVDLQKQLMSLRDRDLLQEVAQVIEETGQYKISENTFDFDLCSLDSETLLKIKSCLNNSKREES